MKGALIGEKLSHSFSAEIHTKLGVDYSLIEVEKNQLENFVNNVNLDFFNVTIPYKKQIISFLDEIDNASKSIGAVNTVIIQNGKKYGYNTDYYGFKNLLIKNSVVVKNKNVLILGTGGTKETVFYVLKEMGASTIRVVSRNGEINLSNCYFNDVNIIVNTTPVGMYPKFDMVDIDLEQFPNLEAVVDCIYNPINTKLVLKAKELNVKAFGGLYMLVSQAVYSNILAKNIANPAIQDEIYKEIFNKKYNLVLVGMPSCGKTTIGEKIAKLLNKEFVDTDKLIEEKYGNIPSIFNNFGEETFRNYESEIINLVSARNNLVISTGGGAILRNENVVSLKHNSIICYIDRDVSLLETTGRPLSKNSDAIKELKKVREPIYKKICNFSVENNSELNSVIKKILEELKNVISN